MESLKTKLKNLLRPLLVNSFALDLVRHVRNKRDFKAWSKAGQPVPPPHFVKQQILSAYATAFSLDTLVETGTYRGDMIYAMKHRFRQITSIELDETLHRTAKRRFRGYSHVEIRQGDSGEVLSNILKDLSVPCLFWLDGHYSAAMTARGRADTPIEAELKSIFGHRIKNHVILIDDARCFDGTSDYPTIDSLRESVAEHMRDYDFLVRSDVIRIYPRHVGYPTV